MVINDIKSEKNKRKRANNKLKYQQGYSFIFQWERPIKQMNKPETPKV